MAVDPVTLKMAAKAAIKIATDEEARKKVLIIVLSPVIGAVLLITMITHIITMPFQAIADFFGSNDVERVEPMQQDYGYLQAIMEGSADYTESAGLDFSGVVFTDGATEVVYFNQLDSRWKDKPYGPDNIAMSSSYRLKSLFVQREFGRFIFDSARSRATSSNRYYIFRYCLFDLEENFVTNAFIFFK